MSVTNEAARCAVEQWSPTPGPKTSTGESRTLCIRAPLLTPGFVLDWGYVLQINCTQTLTLKLALLLLTAVQQYLSCDVRGGHYSCMAAL